MSGYQPTNGLANTRTIAITMAIIGMDSIRPTEAYRDEHGNLKVGRLLGLTGHAFNRRAGNTAVAQCCAQGRTGTNQTCSKYRSYYHKSIFHL